ncbi:hypothetical protein BDN71DRAFT_650264 [Pleurotus eryngii]|uniref:Uncharacterized protein n=1 Tax=Pleurotus eryngii TaxID=5323 RepID=A0A9P5ZFP2_PLEER|nr:hypothetical protein BDN71DRAFT_650264 [Pleurotus eryngii]
MNKHSTRPRSTWSSTFVCILCLWSGRDAGATGVCRLKARVAQPTSTPPPVPTTDGGFVGATTSTSGSITSSRASSASAAPIPLPSVVDDTQNESIDVNNLPTQCRSRCNAVADAVNSCTSSSTTCACTRGNQDNVVECLECMVLLAPGVVEVLRQAQESIDELERSCSDAGISLPHRTIIDSSADQLLLLQRDDLPFPRYPNVSSSWLD